METDSVITVQASPLARKKRVRYTAYYPAHGQAPAVLYSGSEAGYKAHSSNYEEMFPVVTGSKLALSDYLLANSQLKVVVHKENWENLSRRTKEPFLCKRAIGDYSSDSIYQTELTAAQTRRSSKIED